MELNQDTHLSHLEGVLFQGFFEFHDGELIVLFENPGKNDEWVIAIFKVDHWLKYASYRNKRDHAWKLFVSFIQDDLNSDHKFLNPSDPPATAFDLGKRASTSNRVIHRSMRLENPYKANTVEYNDWEQGYNTQNWSFNHHIAEER